MSNQMMGDKEFLNDSIASQKYAGSGYNTFANECVNPQLRATFLNILREEHDIQAELFSEMQQRGWYQVAPADQNKVMQARQKFQSS